METHHQDHGGEEASILWDLQEKVMEIELPTNNWPIKHICEIEWFFKVRNVEEEMENNCQR